MCSRKVLYEWCVIGRYKIVNYVMLTFSEFFHYVSSMHVNNPNLACDFQFYVQRFLRFGLAMMSVLEHEFVHFNKPYLCFFFFFFTYGRMMLKIMSLPCLLQKDSILFGALILSIVWVFQLLFNKLILKTLFLICL